MKLTECQKLESVYANNFFSLYGFHPILNYKLMRTQWKRLNGHYSVDKLCDLMTLWFVSSKGAWCGYKITNFQSDINELLVAYSSIPWENYGEDTYKLYCDTCDECGLEKRDYDEWRAGIIKERFASVYPSR